MSSWLLPRLPPAFGPTFVLLLRSFSFNGLLYLQSTSHQAPHPMWFAKPPQRLPDCTPFHRLHNAEVFRVNSSSCSPQDVVAPDVSAASLPPIVASPGAQVVAASSVVISPLSLDAVVMSWNLPRIRGCIVVRLFVGKGHILWQGGLSVADPLAELVAMCFVGLPGACMWHVSSGSPG